MNEIISVMMIRILMIIGVIVIIVYGGYIQIQYYEQTEEYCDNKYGVNGWEFNETTGTGENKYYIGQVWQCVSNKEGDNI